MFESMKVLVVDTTHGGSIIASEFLKLPEHDVYAWDIYSTMGDCQKNQLESKGLHFVGKEFLDDAHSMKDVVVIAPVHCNLEIEVNMTHHDAVCLLLKEKINVPIIEVTGVKGKTSTVAMLKEIFKEYDPLVLSSLGVEVFENHEWRILRSDISITPASMIEAWELSKGHDIGICIFETSLGGTGLADVGILTNLVENYPIANNTLSAHDAKSQIFKSKIVGCDSDSFYSYYREYGGKTNTFGCSTNLPIKNSTNITASQIRLRFDKTTFSVDVINLKTLDNHIINTSFEISTFAPAPIHVDNVLAAVCASLMMGVQIKKIQQGLNNFRGLNGRTSMRNYKGARVIEEINPGLNSASVKLALSMVEDMEKVTVIFGGKYGITCEEINERSVADIFKGINRNIHLIFVDELGANVKKLLKRDHKYSDNIETSMDFAVENGSSNILLIYRSNYSDIKKR